MFLVYVSALQVQVVILSHNFLLLENTLGEEIRRKSHNSSSAYAFPPFPAWRTMFLLYLLNKMSILCWLKCVMPLVHLKPSCLRRSCSLQYLFLLLEEQKYLATTFSKLHTQFFICMRAKLLQSCPTLCDPMTYSQAPLSMGFSRQEYQSGLPCPSPEDLPNPRIETASWSFAGRFFTTSSTWEAQLVYVSSRATQMVQVERNPRANAGGVRDTGSILESGRSPGVKMGLQRVRHD